MVSSIGVVSTPFSVTWVIFRYFYPYYIKVGSHYTYWLRPPLLTPCRGLETTFILKQLVRSHRALAELKGYADTMPNKNILINAVTINEAKDSSAIENIITTHDELLEAMSRPLHASPAAKNVIIYRSALWQGYVNIRETSLLTTNMMVDIQQMIESNRAGFILQTRKREGLSEDTAVPRCPGRAGED